MRTRCSKIVALAFWLLPLLVVGCSGGRTQSTAPLAVPPPVATAPPSSPAPAPVNTPATGEVFVATNDSAANSILVLTPGTNGVLSLTETIATGGKGSGGGLQNQGGIALNEDRTLLFVVNAGSNDFSVFHVNGSSLALASRTPSGGLDPVSLSAAKGIVYVLNDGSRSGAADNVSGFRFAADGTVTSISNSTRALSQGATGAAQVAIGPAGDVVLVTERGTAIIDQFVLDAGGVPDAGRREHSSGTIPFGFQFLDATHVFVSEEGDNAVSSYTVGTGGLSAVTRSAPNFQAATCWLAIAPSGRFLYTTNTSAGTISAFTLAPSGEVALIGSSGVAIRASGRPIDATVSQDGQFLYVVNSGAGLDTFRVAVNGGLTLVQTLNELGGSLNGVVAD